MIKLVIGIILLVVSIVCALIMWHAYKNQLKNDSFSVAMLVFANILPLSCMSIYYGYDQVVNESISDECWVYLKGVVYCPHCKAKHNIYSIGVKQVWTNGTSDEGWEAYVYPKEEGERFSHDAIGFELTMHNHHVIRMRYDPDIIHCDVPIEADIH